MLNQRPIPKSGELRSVHARRGSSMTLFALLLCATTASVADAFRPPSTRTRLATGADASPRQLPTTSASSRWTNARPKGSATARGRFVLSGADGDANLAEDLEPLDAGLSREIEEALSLAQDALAVEAAAGPDEEDIDEIANMLLEKPPVAPPPPLPVPPLEEPPESLVSLMLEEGAEEESPSPPEEDPNLAEMLRKKAAEEIARMKNLIFGLEEELAETESSAATAEATMATLKKEIEDSIREREALVQRIESEAASEKQLLAEQMDIASKELQVVMDESAQNVTDAKAKAARGEDDLMSRLEPLKVAIDKVTSEIIGIKSNKEEIEKSKQTMLEKAFQEGKDKLAQFQNSFQFDIDYAKRINADLTSRAEEAEQKVRGAFDRISQMKTEQVTLQQQIMDVEKNALGEIASLERELEEDNQRYATALQKERDRLDNVIDVAYQAYAIKICKKIVQREAVEADYGEKLRNVNMQIIAAKEKQEARVKEYLDQLEKKFKKERIAIYQKKFEEVSAMRDEMNAELAVEYARIEEIHETMRPKIDVIKEETAKVKAEFEQELKEKRQLAKEEERELLSQIEDVRADMTDKIKTQRRVYDEKKAAYLEGMNAKISDSEVELRQKWRELAVVNQDYNEVSAQKDSMIDSVGEQRALIESYESDQRSFKKSLRLTARVAREKIGSKTRRLLRRDKKKSS
ncbi:hypothetical protein ACHAWF_005604 [Thalassiosira exigua]